MDDCVWRCAIFWKKSGQGHLFVTTQLRPIRNTNHKHINATKLYPLGFQRMTWLGEKKWKISDEWFAAGWDCGGTRSTTDVVHAWD